MSIETAMSKCIAKFHVHISHLQKLPGTDEQKLPQKLDKLPQ